jgi:hypothetical protein
MLPTIVFGTHPIARWNAHLFMHAVSHKACLAYSTSFNEVQSGCFILQRFPQYSYCHARGHTAERSLPDFEPRARLQTAYLPRLSLISLLPVIPSRRPCTFHP